MRTLSTILTLSVVIAGAVYAAPPWNLDWPAVLSMFPVMFFSGWGAVAFWQSILE
jgi:hypothetical protein